MLVIKQKQLEAFKEASYERFIEKSLIFLDENFSAWARGQREEELRAFIIETIEFGEKIGIFSRNKCSKANGLRYLL